MAFFKLYFSPAVMLLLCICPLCQLGQSAPVMGKGPMRDCCLLHARTLLQNITDVLSQKQLFSGIDCKRQSIELNMETETASVCAPKGSTCSGIKSEFNKESCVKNIGEDLQHHYRFLASQPEPDSSRLTTLLSSLRELMQKCFTWEEEEEEEEEEPAANRQSTYAERLRMCKVLRGFHVRTITINRAIAYMNSGEHTE